MDGLSRRIALAVQRRFLRFDPVIVKECAELPFEHGPPIFMIGSPRTGSTLAYQLMVRSLELSYISNIMALVPSGMVMLTGIHPPAATGYSGKLRQGRYGYIPGLASPNEAGRIMDWWFGHGKDKGQKLPIHNTLARISRYTRAPVMLKNLSNTLRIPAILDIIPDARFLLITRDIRYTAQSLYLARKDWKIRPDGWWSVAPPGYKEWLGRSCEEQAVWQAAECERLARKALGRTRALAHIMAYEDLCASPGRELEAVAEKFSLKWRSQDWTPETIPSANRIRVPEKVWKRLEHLARSLV